MLPIYSYTTRGLTLSGSILPLMPPQRWQEKFYFSGKKEQSLCTDVSHTPKSTLPLRSTSAWWH